MKKNITRLFSVLLAAVLVFGTLPVSAMGTDVADPPAGTVDDTAVAASAAEPEEDSADDAAQPEEQSAEEENVAVQSSAAVDRYSMNIFFLDCGRKYYSVDNIKKFIDNASTAGFNYIQLAVGNDGLRLLLNDMSLTVNGTTYSSDAVATAIHEGNQEYDKNVEDEKGNLLNNYSPKVDELTQSEMETIITYAQSKNMGVIPCVNTPGHMDAILYAAEKLTQKTCSYDRSVRTIDVTNDTAVAFTQALLRKYIDYFAGMGCKYFNMGADEYANDVYKGTNGMGFGVLQSNRQYDTYIKYINSTAAMIKNAKMTPMAFNDGIYYGVEYDSYTGTIEFDTDIIVCYWSSGWGVGYAPAPASYLVDKGFKMVNTHGDYYWVIGKGQCTAETAAKFNYQQFMGSNVTNPVGSMFCIWADYPGNLEEDEVISKSAATIAAFGSTLPKLKEKLTVSIGDSAEEIAATNLGVGSEQVLTASKKVKWSVEDENVVSLTLVSDVATYSYSTSATAKAVTAKAVGAGETTITVTDPDDETVTASVQVSVQKTTEETITVAVGQEKTITVPNHVTPGSVEDFTKATVSYTQRTGTSVTVAQTPVTEIESGKQYVIATADGYALTANSSEVNDWGTELLSLSNNGFSTDTVWTLTKSGSGYTVANGGKYLYMNTNQNQPNAPTSAVESSQTLSFEQNDGYWIISYSSGNTWNARTWYLNNFGNSNEFAGGYYGGNKNDEGNKWYIYEATTKETPETELTFKGLEEGETTVVVDSVKYTIKVLPEKLTNVDPLKIEYWVTNAQGKDSNGSNNLSVSATDNDVATDEGVAVADILPPTVNTKGRVQKYWRSTMLDVMETNDSASGTELQCTLNADDDTWSGDIFTKVRYNSDSSKWQVYNASGEWQDVVTDETTRTYTGGTYTGPRNQLVAYYTEQMDIANNTSGDTELKINAADWGVKGNSSESWGYGPESSRCTVSIQIVYEDGTNPSGTDADSLKSKTFVYSLNSERGIGTMIFDAQQNYEITKVTATTGTMTDDVVNDSYINVTNLTWKDDEQTVWGGNDGDAAKSAMIYNSNRSPDISNKKNLTWISGTNNAILIRVYMKTVANKDSLCVHYVDVSNGGSDEFYWYYINVNEGTTFDTRFGLDENGVLQYNGVETDAGITRYVQTDLTNLTEIGARYRYSSYKCVDAKRNDDKNVYLYYTFDNTVSFVIDFGTSLTLKPTDISAKLGAAGVTISEVKVAEGSITHGTVEYDNNGNFTYKPNSKFVSSQSGETLQVTYYGTVPVKDDQGNETVREGYVAYTVYIYPASNVLYEENFLTDGGVENSGWTKVPGSHTTAQETQKANEENKNLFGYDESYESSYKDSDGKITANGVWKAEKLGQEGGMNITETLNTEFYGNTFDLIGNCNPTTGRVVLVISEKEKPTVGKILDIDTRYNDDDICQVPLAHVVMGTEDKDYNVAIYAARLAATTVTTTPRGVATMSLDDADAEIDDVIAQILEENGMSLADVEYERVSMMDRLNATSAVADVPGDAVATYADEENTIVFQAGTHVEIDGFRVYRTTDAKNNVAQNYPENEQNKTYWNIIDVMQGEMIEAYRDNVSGPYTSIKVSEYEKAGGPQNEIYLASGQSIAFKIDNVSEIQVSLRAVNSTPVTWNGGTITSNTEMYYPLTKDENGNFVITNSNEEGNGLLAIGNVKIASKVTQNDITSASGIDQEALKASVLAVLNGGTEEPEVFTPDTFTAKATATKVIRNKVVTLKVTVSSDVEYVTINGVKYTRTGFQSAFNKNRTILVVNTVPKNETKTYEIVAYNADDVASETKTVTG